MDSANALLEVGDDRVDRLASRKASNWRVKLSPRLAANWTASIACKCM
jgi:hypothetical protein